MDDKNALPVTAFYDRIAGEYNRRMTASDSRVRETVSRVFRQYVPPGNIMDFGGGTGLDLPWLLASRYRVFFLEPSVNMRAVAKASLPARAAQMPVWMEEHTDIRDWHPGHLPCREKMSGILANFAVLNCIKEPAVFFEKIALICGSRCFIVACMIDPRLPALSGRYPVKEVLRSFLKGTLVTRHAYEGIWHETYIHPVRRLRNASRPHFHFVDCLPLENSGFTLLIFSGK